MAKDRLAARLTAGLEQGAIRLDDEQKQRLLEYLFLLSKWNSAYNLTAVRDLGEMISRHLLDSLALLPWLDGLSGNVLDVGSGAGLPGIPLAIARPRRRFVLLDSNGKKTRFLFQARLSLELDNLDDIVAERIEAYQPAVPPAVIVSRAFASLAQYRDLTRHLWQGRQQPVTLLAMKAAAVEDELEELRREPAEADDGEWRYRTVALEVPGSEAERRLVIMQRTTTENTGS